MLSVQGSHDCSVEHLTGGPAQKTGLTIQWPPLTTIGPVEVSEVYAKYEQIILSNQDVFFVSDEYAQELEEWYPDPQPTAIPGLSDLTWLTGQV